MQEVRFYYPEELLASMNDADKAAQAQKADPPQDGAVTSLKSLDPAALNFAYAVAGPKVAWRPVRAFDDGKHVYIQMRQRMESSEAPVLMVAANSGNQMVNYRVKGDYYVVDKLFDEAVRFRRRTQSGPREDRLHRRPEVMAMAALANAPTLIPQGPRRGGARLTKTIVVVVGLSLAAAALVMIVALHSASQVATSPTSSNNGSAITSAEQSEAVKELEAAAKPPTHAVNTPVPPALPPQLSIAQAPTFPPAPQPPSRYA
jgi:hypothetical protein